MSKILAVQGLGLKQYHEGGICSAIGSNCVECLPECSWFRERSDLLHTNILYNINSVMFERVAVRDESLLQSCRDRLAALFPCFRH